jgi:hypothetical protein
MPGSGLKIYKIIGGLATSARQHRQGGDDLREAAREVIAIGPSSLQRFTIFGSDRRHSGHFSRSLEMSKMTLMRHGADDLYRLARAMLEIERDGEKT